MIVCILFSPSGSATLPPQMTDMPKALWETFNTQGIFIHKHIKKVNAYV